MIPGMSARPSASTASRVGPMILPISQIRPLFTATPPRFGGAPWPSSSSASRITRSYMRMSILTRKSGTDPIFQLDLTGKIAVVTGGAKGIGAATVKLFQKAGAKVEVLDIEQGFDVTKEDTVQNAFSKT